MATSGDFHWPPVGRTHGHHRGQSTAIDGENLKAIDNVFLACAFTGGAGYIVSGDRHLRDVSGWRGISVLSPRRFFDEVLGSSTAIG